MILTHFIEVYLSGGFLSHLGRGFVRVGLYPGFAIARYTIGLIKFLSAMILCELSPSPASHAKIAIK